MKNSIFLTRAVRAILALLCAVLLYPATTLSVERIESGAPRPSGDLERLSVIPLAKGLDALLLVRDSILGEKRQIGNS